MRKSLKKPIFSYIFGFSLTCDTFSNYSRFNCFVQPNRIPIPGNQPNRIRSPETIPGIFSQAAEGGKLQYRPT